jgi:hypothetical protein
MIFDFVDERRLDLVDATRRRMARGRLLLGRSLRRGSRLLILRRCRKRNERAHRE